MKNTRISSTLLITTALLGACGGGGGGGGGSTSTSSSGASTTPVTWVSGYDVAAKVAEIRTTYGSDWTTAAPNAPNGLELPAAPNVANCGGALTVVNVSSIAAVNAQTSGTCKHIILAPGTYVSAGSISISGQDLRLTLSGVTFTPDAQSYALDINHLARRVEVTASDTAQATLNNGWVVGQAMLGWAEDIKLKNLRFVGQGVISTLSSTDINAVYIKGHRVLVERVYCYLAGGCFFSADDSTNLIAANSEFVVPTAPGTNGMNNAHENPSRLNKTNFGVVMDSRLWADQKHTLRVHNQCGVIGWFRNQSERGGIMTQQVPGTSNPQASKIYLVGWKLYRPSGMGNNLLAIPRTQTAQVSTDLLYMTGNTAYSAPHEGVNGAGLLPTGTDSPFASWTTVIDAVTALINGNAYATYTAAPAWSFN